MDRAAAKAVVRAPWARLRARDWASARPLLRDAFTSTSWTSGERWRHIDWRDDPRAVAP